jgi:hypothetical protein
MSSFLIEEKELTRLTEFIIMEVNKNKYTVSVLKKYVELNNPENIIYEFPEEYKPQVEVKKNNNDSKYKQSDINVIHLITNNLLKPADKLYMEYGPRKGEKKKYVAEVRPDGSLLTLNQVFKSPGGAAVAVIQDAGSNRTTVNGWVTWKTVEGKTLSDLWGIYICDQTYV